MPCELGPSAMFQTLRSSRDERRDNPARHMHLACQEGEDAGDLPVSRCLCNKSLRVQSSSIKKRGPPWVIEIGRERTRFAPRKHLRMAD